MDFLELNKNKIINEQALDSRLSYWQFKGYRIVFTNGCFDILHAGHVDYLSKARSLGDILVIGLNTDASVARIKGKNRPVNSQTDRALILASLNFVDAIVLFDEDTPYNLIKKVQPDVLVKGSDYKPEEIVGYDVLKAKSGEVVTVDYLEGYSTSSLIERLRNPD